MEDNELVEISDGKKMEYLYKVLMSCETQEQAEVAINWGNRIIQLIFNRHKGSQ